MSAWNSVGSDSAPRLPADRWPRILVLTALALFGLFALETLRFPLVDTPITLDFLVGTVTSLPFLLLIAYGGYWVEKRGIPPARQHRIGYWMFGGLVLFLVINIMIMPVFPRRVSYEYLAWVRWAAAIGGGVGTLVGIFEAKAIARELEAERRRLENQQLAVENDRLDEFATILSHDLRNPLNVAVGNIELATQEYESETLDNATDALARMDDIIEETLTLARSGRVIGETEVVDLGDLAKDCWRSVETTDATLDIEDPLTIDANIDRIRHLLENLFRNSVHHAGPSVTIRVGNCPDGFYVADDGPGIPEADRDAVFSAGYSSANDGNGFGLAIVKQIVDAHGWSVRATEGADGGARFEFTDVTVLE